MIHLTRFLTSLLLICGICSSGLAAAAEAGASYEAPLPVQLSTDPDLCAYVPCKDVMPGADSFSPRMGKPAYVEAYQSTNGEKGDHGEKDGNGEKGDRGKQGDRGEKDGRGKQGDHGEKDGRKLIGYVFLSTDIVDIPAYSGKPVVTLIGMDTKGIVTGVRVLRHSEPILLLGIPESELTKFIKQYVGKFVGAKIEVGAGRPDQGVIGLDAITGATVTVIAQNQVMLRSGIEIAKQVGIIKPTIRPQAKFTAFSGKLSWDEMVREGSIQRLTVSPDDVGARGDGPYIDMYFGYLNAPAVGKSVLGEYGYNSLMSSLKPGEHAIFVIASGMESFKGSGFVRGGIYDRIL